MVVPVDAFLRDFGAPALVSAGFRRVGRVFVKDGHVGDVVAVKFQPAQGYAREGAAFFINHDFSSAADRAAITGVERNFDPTWHSIGPNRPQTAVDIGLNGPGRDSGGDEYFIPLLPSEVGQRRAATMGDHLRTMLVPFLDGWLDPCMRADMSFALQDRTRSSMGGVRIWSPSVRFNYLVDHGLSRDLAESWLRMQAGRFCTPERREIALRRMAERYGDAADLWRDNDLDAWLAPVRLEHREVLDALTWALSALGFVRDGAALRAHNDLGDQVVIQVRPAATSTRDTFAFSIDIGLTLSTSWAYKRSRRDALLAEPAAEDGMICRRVTPPDQWRQRSTSTAWLELDQWSTPNGQIAMCATDAVHVTQLRLDQVLPLLDRDTLADYMRARRAQRAEQAERNDRARGVRRIRMPVSVDQLWEEIIVDIDRDPARIRTAIADALSAGANPSDREIVWAQAQLDLQSRTVDGPV